MTDWTTNPSLLQRLSAKQPDEAWTLFFNQYALALHVYAVRLGLSPSLAEEVVQETMIEMMRILPEFVYNPEKRFRNFLLTVAHRKALRHMRREKKRHVVQETYGQEWTRLVEERTRGEFESEEERSWRWSLFLAAWKELQMTSRAKASNLEIFEAAVIRGEAVASVADRFGVTPNAIYQIKIRTSRRLRMIVADLEADLQ
ncbi:MAG: sigma-70 family RNA polymerase sigma factor [Opitutales bacterium]|nr:sigma-70 family RNA polymerase sigma factor [Opitutales bacterium]